MVSVDHVLGKLGNHSMIIYQYMQVQNLVNLLRKYYKISIRDFEVWMVDLDNQKKLLSKMYNLLLSLQVVVD